MHNYDHREPGFRSATREEIYLDYAKNAAIALIYGQYPLGGRLYFIDFDMEGLEPWYEEVATKFTG